MSDVNVSFFDIKRANKDNGIPISCGPFIRESE